MPTIKGFNLKKDAEGKATMTNAEGTPIDLTPFRQPTPEEQVKEKPKEPEEPKEPEGEEPKGPEEKPE